MTPFSYLYDPRSDEEVANDYVVRDGIHELTEEGKINLQAALRKLLIKDRVRFRERAENYLKMVENRKNDV